MYCCWMLDLAEIRRAVGRTQVELAAAMGTTQGQVSRIERQSDLLVSTLREYLSALGVQARLVITVDETEITKQLTGGGPQ